VDPAVELVAQELQIGGTGRYYIINDSAACKHETLAGQWHLPAGMPDE